MFNWSQIRFLILVLVALLLSACGFFDLLKDTTRLRIKIYQIDPKVTQMNLEVLDGHTLVIARNNFIEAGATLSETESLTVLFDADLAAKKLKLRIHAFADKNQLSSGQITINLIEGKLNEVQLKLGKAAIVGDGKIRKGIEECDDGNLESKDGCSELGFIERGWYCSKEPSVCQTDCGDEIIAGEEECDDVQLQTDAGVNNNLDGCSACRVTDGWECFGQPSVCSPKSCGDGKIVEPEECDDGNSVSKDGCSADCLKETGYECIGAPSDCAKCGDGLYNAGREYCDDGNNSDGDGCSKTCVIEEGYSCDFNAEEHFVCGPTCGDGRIFGAEQCDDFNHVSGDGCSQNCEIEEGFECQIISVLGEDSSGDRCSPICGDGYITGGETCDQGELIDGGEPINGDGCSDVCVLEPGYKCSSTGNMPSVCSAISNFCIDADGFCLDGNTVSGDGCSEDCRIEKGYACNAESSPACQAVCGDGFTVEAVEECDDRNLANNDGCYMCKQDTGWKCKQNVNIEGQDQSLCEINCGDGLTVVPFEQCDFGREYRADCDLFTCKKNIGYECIVNADLKVTCSQCGDGERIAEIEECDDHNQLSGDGCSAECKIERSDSWSCSLTEGGGSICQKCGNGKREGTEECDNSAEGDALSGDGCSADCKLENNGWQCLTPFDNLSFCAKCGDGLRVNEVEDCDDNNLKNGDGCSTDCKEEVGFICAEDSTGLSTCEEKLGCGDGIIQENEECDDGNTTSLDGCSENCNLEGSWMCDEPNQSCYGCGDGIVQENEECDMGLTGFNDGCDNNLCIINRAEGWNCENSLGGESTCFRCGDGERQLSEECDDGNNNDYDDACLSNCKHPFCGDKVINFDRNLQILEECDDGDDNLAENACTPQCKKAICGDGFQINNKEQCDFGIENSSAAGCSKACTLRVCGDGIKQDAEKCDVGFPNFSFENSETCDENCNADSEDLKQFCIGSPTVCGSNIINAGYCKDCIDGNILNCKNVSSNLTMVPQFQGLFNLCINSLIREAPNNSIIYLPEGQYTGEIGLGKYFIDIVNLDLKNKSIILMGEVTDGEILTHIKGTGTANTINISSVKDERNEGYRVKIHLQDVHIEGAKKNYANIFSNEVDTYISVNNVEVGPSEGKGIVMVNAEDSSLGAELHMYNTIVRNNKAGGVELSSKPNNNKLHQILNTIIYENGSDESDFGGIQTNKYSQIEFSTIVNNHSKETAGLSPGVNCDAENGEILRSLLVYNNVSAGSGASQQVANNCEHISWSVFTNYDSNYTGTALYCSSQTSNINAETYELSPQAACIDFVEQGNFTEDIYKFDRLHLPRPHPSSSEAKLDCGAQEFYKYWLR